MSTPTKICIECKKSKYFTDMTRDKCLRCLSFEEKPILRKKYPRLFQPDFHMCGFKVYCRSCDKTFAMYMYTHADECKCAECFSEMKKNDYCICWHSDATREVTIRVYADLKMGDKRYEERH